VVPWRKSINPAFSISVIPAARGLSGRHRLIEVHKERRRLLRKSLALFAFAVLLFTLTTPVLAAEAGAGNSPVPVNWVAITAGFSMAIASAACGYAQARATAAAAEGLARNPGAAPAIRFALILALVLIESMALYTFAIIFIKVT
jgi:F-type H+-transporting ATPase subunit c